MNFDTKAREWDTEERLLRAHMIADEMKKDIAGETYHKSLEFGCGTGLVSFNLHNLLREITLVDNSEEMIRVLKTKIANCKIHNMAAFVLDIENGEKLPQKPAKYDLIYMSMALHHILDTEAVLRIFWDHLEENGRIIVVDLTEDDGSYHKSELDFDGHNGFNLEELADLFDRIGFVDTTSRIFYSGVRKTENGSDSFSLFLMTAKKGAWR